MRSASATTTASPPWWPTSSHADALVLLSDVDGLYDGPPHRAGSVRVPLVGGAHDLADVVVQGSASTVGTGGMATKLEAAAIAATAGVTTLLTSADQVRAGLAGEDVGTLFTPTGSRSASRLLWLAHATEPRGRVLLDDGAVRAVVERRKSLLPAGIVAVEGRFDEGDPVDVCTATGPSSPAAWSTTPPTSCPRCSAGPPTTSPATSARSTSARSSTATRSSCSEVCPTGG